MLVSDIIAAAQNLVNVPNASFWTATEQLWQAQLAYKQVYAFLLGNDDDYFVTSVALSLASDFTADPDRTYSYTMTLPDDFMTLRLLQYKGMGTGSAESVFFSCYKSTLQEYGNTQNFPAYRIVGTDLNVYDPVGYPTYLMWYYPSPEVLATDTDIVYPNNLMPEVMSYLLAAEIRRKQHEDGELWVTKANDIMASIRKQDSRDDAKALSPKNVFAEGYDPWY